MNPLTIYQDALDRVTRAVMADDFDAYVANIAMPYLVHTNRATFTLFVEDDLRETFHNAHLGLTRNGITNYERIGREARYVGRDRIEGLHYTHMIAVNDRIAPPYGARMVLIRTATGWRFTEAYYPIDNDRWPLTFPVIARTDLIPPPPETWGPRIMVDTKRPAEQ